MTSKAEIKEWFDNGVKKNAVYMIIVCDTFSYEDYPVYIMPDQNAYDIKEHYDNKNMQRIMEIYDLKLNLDEQLSGRVMAI